ncbi:MAG: hypothetical protein ACMG57_02075, partial [Candidatus Dojkabacteria bacterium]
MKRSKNTTSFKKYIIIGCAVLVSLGAIFFYINFNNPMEEKKMPFGINIFKETLDNTYYRKV